MKMVPHPDPHMQQPERFGKDRILLSSECGFGHVPIDITRAKLGKLVEVSKKY